MLHLSSVIVSRDVDGFEWHLPDGARINKKEISEKFVVISWFYVAADGKWKAGDDGEVIMK